ncbi:hypothetical protein MMC30_001412 [Trapelia coarctata]|nr:hypothetical protein [Trapelia coarctata]
MPRLNNDEQFKFLISCIRWSNNGKVDFTEVAKECKIVTKGAAAKRYERLMKAHNIHQPACSRDSIVPVIRRKEDSHCQTPPSKKRKQDHFADTGDMAANDDEGLGSVKDETDGVDPNNNIVKSEAAFQENTGMGEPVFGNDYPWLRYSASRVDSNEGDEGAAFDDFIVSGAFEPMNATSHFEDASAAKPGEGGGAAVNGGGESSGSILILD